MIDLYKTLRLEPLESNVKSIASAIEALSIKQKKLDSKSSARALKVIEFAKTNLLDPGRKAQYDREWQAEFGTQKTPKPAGAKVAAASSPSSRQFDAEFQNLLPVGDPTQSFDRNQFIAGLQSESHRLSDSPRLSESETQLANGSQESQELLSLLQPTSQTTPSLVNEKVEAPATVPASIDEVSETQLEPRGLPETDANSPSESVPLVRATAIDLKASSAPEKRSEQLGSSPRKARTSSASLARKIRRKKDRSLLMIAGGMLGSAALVLATVLVLLNRKDSEPGRQEVLAGLEGNSVDQVADQRKREVRGSGLGGALNKDNGFGGGGGVGADSEPIGFGGPKQDGGEDADQAAIGEQQNTPPQDDSQAAMMGGEPLATPELPDGPNVAMDGKSNTKADVELTEQEKAEWLEAVTRIREDLGQQQYNSAVELLGRLGDMAKTEEQKDELGRLSSVAVLAEEFHFALMEAISGLNAGSVLRVKSTELAFVEATENSIVFRIAGKNQRFLLTELPVGILEAIVDLELDRESFSSKAKRASFILLHPRATNLVKPRMLEMMREAEAGGEVAKGTSLLFDVPAT